MLSAIINGLKCKISYSISTVPIFSSEQVFGGLWIY